MNLYAFESTDTIESRRVAEEIRSRFSADRSRESENLSHKRYEGRVTDLEMAERGGSVTELLRSRSRFRSVYRIETISLRNWSISFVKTVDKKNLCAIHYRIGHFGKGMCHNEEKLHIFKFTLLLRFSFQNKTKAILLEALLLHRFAHCDVGNCIFN